MSQPFLLNSEIGHVNGLFERNTADAYTFWVVQPGFDPFDPDPTHRLDLSNKFLFLRVTDELSTLYVELSQTNGGLSYDPATRRITIKTGVLTSPTNLWSYAEWTFYSVDKTTADRAVYWRGGLTISSGAAG